MFNPEFIDVTFDEDILLLSGQCTNEIINIQQVNRCLIIFEQFGEEQSQDVSNANDLRQGVTSGTRVDEPPEQFGIVQSESIFSPSSSLSFSKMILDGKVGFVNLKNKILKNIPINITTLACFEGEAYPLINNLREINCNNILIMTGSQYSIENKDKNVEMENKFIFNYSNNTYFYSLRNALDNGIAESLFTCSFMNNYIPNSLHIIEKPCEYIFIAYN